MVARICQNCGSELTDEARFCLQCGKEVAVRVCQACGVELVEGASFCLKCGKAVTRVAPVSSPSSDPAASSGVPNPSPAAASSSAPKSHGGAFSTSIIIIIFIVTLIIFINNRSGSPDTGVSQQAIEYLNQGVALANAGRYDEAIAEYNQAIALEPGYALAFYDRGRAYDFNEQDDLGLADYIRAVELDPQEPVYQEGLAIAYYNRGNDYFKSGQFGGAIAYYDEAITFGPKMSGAWNNKGAALEKLGRNQEALDCYNGALALDPNNQNARNNIDNIKTGGSSGDGSSYGNLSVSSNGGDVYVAGKYLGRGGGATSLPPGTYTVTCYRASTGQLCWQTNIVIISGKPSMVNNNTY